MRKRTDRPEDGLSGAAASPRLTPMDIQQKEFGVTRVGGGYRMRDVDEFLDQLTNSMTALVEENGRLREQAGSGAMLGAPDLEQVGRQADEIIARAREEAAQIVRDASTASAAVASIGSDAAASDAGRAAVSAFLLREREFLQSLASLVQGHAEGVKGMAREARAAAPAAARAEPMAAPIPGPEPPVASAAPAGPAVAEIPDAPAVEAAALEPEPAAATTVDRPTEAMEEPVLIDEPEPATVGRAEADEPAEEGDRSLRELFWGEE